MCLVELLSLVQLRKRHTGFITLAAWEFWKEGHVPRIFRQIYYFPRVIISGIKEEARTWVIAGVTCLFHYRRIVYFAYVKTHHVQYITAPLTFDEKQFL
jgi:hypothetical protein